MTANVSRLAAGVVGTLGVLLLIASPARPVLADKLEDKAVQVQKKTLTEKAYQKGLKRLNELEPGSAMTAESVDLGFFRLSDRKQTKIVAAADGWIPSMSGNLNGAVTLLGRPIARDGETIYGRHVFGFVWGNMNLSPQRVLVTAATMISKSEHDELEAGGYSRIGSSEGYEEGEQLYFKDVVVHEIRAVPGAVTLEGASKKERVDAQDIRERLASVYTQASFDEARPILESLTGEDGGWDVVDRLDGMFLTHNQGRSYALFMKGFANKDSDPRWSVLRDDGIYVVWPFGPSETDDATPLLAVVFRNGRFLKVIPYEPREVLASRLGGD